MLMNDDGTYTLQGPATIRVLQVNNDDIWKNLTVFISQFVKNVYDPKVMHDNGIIASCTPATYN